MVSWAKRRPLHHHLIVCAAPRLGSSRRRLGAGFAAAICADCGFCSDEDDAGTTIVQLPHLAASSTDHLSRVPATRHTAARLATVFLLGSNQPYFFLEL